MKKILLTALFALSVLSVSAQNSVLYKANDAMQSGKWEKALDALLPALDNPKTTKFAEIYRKISMCYSNFYNAELQNAVQQLPFDTIRFCESLDNAIQYINKSYEADNAPDKKGKAGEFNAMNKLNLTQMLSNYYYAGIFSIQSGNNEKALEYLQKFYDLPKNPMFTPVETEGFYQGEFKDNYNQSLYFISLLNYQLKRWAAVKESAPKALQADPSNARDLYNMQIQANAELGDSVGYFNILTEAIAKFEKATDSYDDQNFLHMLEYELTRKDKEKALAVVDKFVADYPEIAQSHIAKGYVCLNIEPSDYAGAEAAFKKALEIEPNSIDANTNMAFTYMNEVAYKVNNDIIKFPYGNSAAAQAKVEAVMEKEVRPYYAKARPYMERVRELLPDEPRRWATYLHQIYKNLNMEKEAAEMDAFE